MIKENVRNQKLYKGVFWVIGDRVVSEKKLCDEFGNLVIFLNPCICYEKMIQKIKAEFRLDNNESIRDISVKADGSRHYRCDCEEDVDGQSNISGVYGMDDSA